MKLEVGQTVWLCGINHWVGDRKSNPGNELRETKVQSVGRKWFTVKGCPRHSFDVNTGTQKPPEFMSRHRVYFDKATYDREQHELQYRAKLREYTANQSAWPIETVRAVVELIKSHSDF